MTQEFNLSLTNMFPLETKGALNDKLEFIPVLPLSSDSIIYYRTSTFSSTSTVDSNLLYTGRVNPPMVKPLPPFVLVVLLLTNVFNRVDSKLRENLVSTAQCSLIQIIPSRILYLILTMSRSKFRNCSSQGRQCEDNNCNF